jgi:hypothetical protein
LPAAAGPSMVMIMTYAPSGEGSELARQP